jgi:hypothetical protein
LLSFYGIRQAKLKEVTESASLLCAPSIILQRAEGTCSQL